MKIKTTAQEIMSLYLEENSYHYAIESSEIGRTYENYIKQIKTDEVMAGIEFTLKYLQENKL